jgi:hypothetical protein
VVAQTLPTPETKHRDHNIDSTRQDLVGRPFGEDEDDTQAAESPSKHAAQPVFETPRKAIRTNIFNSPGKRSHTEIVNSSSTWPPITTLSDSDDVFTTPDTSNKPRGLLSPIKTPTHGRSQVNYPSIPPADPPTIASEVLKVLEPVQLPSSVKAQLINVLNRYDLRTLGIAKGRDIARLAIQTKEKKIAELQARITGLEGELETSKNVIAHLKHDIALSPVKGRRGGKRTSEV